MPAAVVSFIGSKLVAIGSALGAASASAGVAMAVGAAAVVAGAVAAQRLISELYSVPNLDSDRSRQATVRGTVEPQKLIYGEALVSGPINFVGVAGEKNRDLYHSIVMAGHPCDSISDIYFDDERIPSSSIAANGDVTSGIFGPKSGDTICVIRKLTGSQTTADSVLNAAFGTINTNEHIGTNLTYIVTKFTLTKKSQDTWDKYLPNDIKALVKGKKVYDPRQDSTSSYYDSDLIGGVSTQRANDSSTWTWSENPVWCLVDYLTDDRFGMNIDLDRIDLSKAVDAAGVCDEAVTVPGGSEKRYTCNGVIFGTSTHKTNINKILSSMNGMLTYTNGKYVIRAGAFEAVGTGMTLTEDHMNGPVKLKTSFERNERFNTITGTFVDPDNNYKEIEFPKVQITSALSRDNNEELTRDLKLSMTNSSFMAQRIAHKLIQLSDLQKVLTFPTNLAGVNISVGDRVNVTLSEFGYTNKTFVCLGWTLSESGSGGVNLTLREDDSSSYADLAVGGYSTVTSAGGIQQGFFGVPDPSALSATAGLKNIELNWTNPDNMTGIISIEIFASADSAWANAQKIGETVGTQFIHDASNATDAIAAGDERYYWVRARRFPDGDGTDAVSDRNPDSDTSTVNATCGRVNWSDVAGSDNAPEDNATQNTGALADLDTVSGAEIDNGAVDTLQIADDAVDITKIADTLQSTNYSQGSAGWKLTTDGTFEAGDGTFRGALTATTLTLDSSIIIGSTNLDSTVVNGAAAGATASQVNKGLALLVNKDSDGDANAGECGLVGVDKDGVPELDTDGFIMYNGDKIVVDRDQFTDGTTIITNISDKQGFICFDANKTNVFTTTNYGDVDVAFVWKEGDQWYYDENEISAVTFTPSTITGQQNGTDGTTTPKLLAIGWLATGNPDVIRAGGLFEPIELENAPFASDTYNSGTIGGIKITGSSIESSNFSAGSAGFKLEDDGTFEAGNGTFRGALTATSLTLDSGIIIGSTNLDSTVVNGAAAGATANQDSTSTILAGTLTGTVDANATIGSTIASTVESGAASGATANQDSTSTILAGNLTGTVNSVAVATVTSGAAAGATALQNGDSITSGAVGPVTITSTQLYQGAGNFNNTDTGFYLDNTGDFSLVDKLVFDASASTLSVDGNIVARDLNITNATVTGNLSADNISIDGVTLDTSDGNLIVAEGGIGDTQISSIDGSVTTISNLQANNIVGDVSEHFNFALGQGIGATSMKSLSSTKQTFDVEIPAPTGGVAKRAYIQGVAIADTNNVTGFDFTLEIRLKAGKSYTHDFTGYDRNATAPYGTSSINYNIYSGNQITDLALGGVWTDYANNVVGVHGFFYDESADETYLLFNDDEGDFQNGDWALTPSSSTTAASNLCLPKFGAPANGEEHTVPFIIILPETTVATTFMITFTGSGFLRGLNGEAGYMR